MSLSVLALSLVLASIDPAPAAVNLQSGARYSTIAMLTAEDESEPEEESDDTGEFEETNEADQEAADEETGDEEADSDYPEDDDLS